MAFSSRIRTYHNWQNADSELKRAKLNHERNRAQGRIPTDRMGHSMSQIADVRLTLLSTYHINSPVLNSSVWLRRVGWLIGWLVG